VLSVVGAHARREFPNECCGLLVGTSQSIDEAVPTRNELAHRSRYQIDPRAHIALNRRVRGTGRSVVGAYHSHPATPAEPSPRDLAEAQYPEFVWLIVSLEHQEPAYGLFRIARGRATAVEFVRLE
jgi:proteasome lid subunit RPN8/RPN11